MNYMVSTFKVPKRERYHCPPEHYTADLEDLSLERAGPTPISPVVTGFIRLRGVLTQITWEQSPIRHRGQVDLSFPAYVGHMNGRQRMPDVTGSLDYMTTLPTHGRSYYSTRIEIFHRLILEFVRKGIYRRIGTCKTAELYHQDSMALISKRRRGHFRDYKGKVPGNETEPYKHYPFKIHYSEDECTTKVSRKASIRELQEREADTEEVVFTII
jgi:hypothetical protein